MSTEQRGGDEREADTAPDEPDAAESPVEDPVPDSETRHPGAGGRGLAAVALVLALIGVAGAGTGGYLGYRLHQDLTSRLEAVGSTAERASARADKASAAADEIDALSQRTDRLGDEVEALRAERAETEAAITRLRERVERNRRGWVLAEAEYLMRLANRRLQLARDVGTARAALRAADSRLQSLDDPALTEVRQRLGEEIEALKAMPRPDLTGLASRLAGLEQRVGDLPLDVAQPRSMRSAKAPGPEPGEVDSWRGFANAVWLDLKGLVNVRRHRQPVEPMLPPDQQYFLEQNLRLKLEAARLALLRDEPGVYRESIDAARRWIGRYFEADAPGVQAALTSLRELAEVDLDPELPDVTRSLRALERARRTLDSAQGAES